MLLPDLPPALLKNLTPEEREGLRRVLDALGPELAALYADEVADHSEARGDDGQLFGMKIWTHGWFRYSALFAEDPLVRVLKRDGSWELRIGRLRIGIYRQGSTADDSVHCNVPGSESDAKRSYGDHNEAQLALFETAPRLAGVGTLFDLTISHFGNSREGLTKWYIGAQAPAGSWAWVARRPMADANHGGDLVRLPPMSPTRPSGGGIAPFDQRPVDEVSVRPRVRPLREVSSKDDPE